MIADITEPDSAIARQAEELARRVSSDTLFNHVMRCYWFAELFAQQEGTKVDSELMFLSAVLHDLGLTEEAPGPHRFEVEGAGVARSFLEAHGVPAERAQLVWDNIALHTWDVNPFRGDTSRLMQLGLSYDVSGVQDAGLDPADVAEVLRRYPRLQFKRAFNELLNREVDTKQPYNHWVHICTRVAHNRSPIQIVDAPVVLDWAPFDE
ncbi:HD domain-containing protein [Streptomyces sp. NPDC048489]|uniref:HD domain-containing protein n=1 Tax=Streptomyces sp. NPDC048489 TaxID=3154504 RepID=UPI003442BDC3